MYRHNPQTKQAGELVAGGAVGELRLVRGAFGFVLDRPGDVRLNAELDGGALMDVGCYCVSGARLFCGEPEVAIGRQVLDPGGVDVRFAGALAFPDEVLAHFDCGLDVPFTSFLEVVGSEGTLRLPSPFLIQDPGIELLREGDSPEWIEVEEAGSYRLEFEDMGAAIRGDREPLLGQEDAIGQARAIEALYRSAAAGGEPVPCAEVGDG
jgi:predicted dehydrogenase